MMEQEESSSVSRCEKARGLHLHASAGGEREKLNKGDFNHNSKGKEESLFSLSRKENFILLFFSTPGKKERPTCSSVSDYEKTTIRLFHSLLIYLIRVSHSCFPSCCVLLL